MTKSLVNFDVTIDGMKTPRLQGSKYFPFCGAMINVETLDVIKDSTRMEYTSMSFHFTYLIIDMPDSLTVERTQTPGKALIVKTLKYSK